MTLMKILIILYQKQIFYNSTKHAYILTNIALLPKSYQTFKFQIWGYVFYKSTYKVAKLLLINWVLQFLFMKGNICCCCKYLFLNNANAPTTPMLSVLSMFPPGASNVSSANLIKQCIILYYDFLRTISEYIRCLMKPFDKCVECTIQKTTDLINL